MTRKELPSGPGPDANGVVDADFEEMPKTWAMRLRDRINSGVVRTVDVAYTKNPIYRYFTFTLFMAGIGNSISEGKPEGTAIAFAAPYVFRFIAFEIRKRME